MDSNEQSAARAELEEKIAKYRALLPMIDELTARRVKSLIADLEQILRQQKSE